MEIKTTQVTCPNGHHYDSAQYSACPVCGASAGGFPHTEPVNGGGFTPTKDPYIPDQGGDPRYNNGGATEPVPGPDPGYDYDQHTGAVTQPADNMRHRDGNYSYQVKTQIGGDMAAGSQVEPVVGWLVCIDGPVRGVDYRIHAGYNYIGRDYGDIHIKGDRQISRENHAMIASDNTDNIFFVGPAAGRNLIKVNGRTVINAIELSRGDVVSIGTTKLIFIPLCGDDFSWTEGVKPNG